MYTKEELISLINQIENANIINLIYAFAEDFVVDYPSIEEEKK